MAITLLRRHAGQKPFLGARLDPTHPLARGLMAAYHLNEGGGTTLNDATGRSPATVAGGPPWISGPQGAALRFAGTGAQYAATPDAPWLATGAGDVTYEVWANPSPAQTGFLLTKRDSSVYTQTSLLIAGNSEGGTAGSNFCMLLYQGGATAPQRGFKSVAAVADGNWHHFVGVYNGSTASASLYVDGVAVPVTVDYNAGTPPNVTNTEPLSIGAGAQGGALPLTGSVAVARAWSRTLSAAEVATLYTDPYAMFQAPRLIVPASAGGALKSQTLTAAQATAPLLSRATAKQLAALQASVPLLQRATAHGVALAQGGLTTLTRAITKGVSAAQATSALLSTLKAKTLIVTATQGTVAGLARGIAKAVGATQGTTPALARGIAKAISVTQATLTILSSLKSKVLTLTAVQSSTPVLTRSFGRVVTATQASTATLQRGFSKSVAATQTTLTTLAALKSKIIAFALTQASAPALGRGVTKSMAAAQSSTLVVARGIAHALTATQATNTLLSTLKSKIVALAALQGSAPALTRAIVKPLMVVQTSATAINRVAAKGLAWIQGTASTLGVGRGRLIALAVTQGSLATLTRATSRVVALGQSSTATLTRGVTHSLTALQGALAALTSGRGRIVVLTVAQASLPALTRSMGKSLSATQATVAGLGRAIGKALGWLQTAIATLTTHQQGPGTAPELPRLAYSVVWRGLTYNAPWRIIQYTYQMGAAMAVTIVGTNSIDTLDQGLVASLTITNIPTGVTLGQPTLVDVLNENLASLSPTHMLAFVTGALTLTQTGTTAVLSFAVGNGATVPSDVGAEYTVIVRVPAGGSSQVFRLPVQITNE